VGIAPLGALARELEPRSFDFYAGFKDAQYGLEGLSARTLVIATEDGSGGRRGLIPDFFSPGAYSVVYACGPLPMLKALYRSCRAAGVPCYVSMEEHMACGVGACLGCRVETRKGNRRCCADGPIFDAEDLTLE
jgi:NAD(P)H-flavin reductase